jgi:type III restriction enzyme
VEGYRVELPTERLTATFTPDSVMELTPDLVGPTKTRTQGIIGEAAELDVAHLEDVRPSTVLFKLTTHLLYNNWRDTGDEPKLHLFGSLKRIAKQWLDTCLVCKGGTYPALLLYQDLAEMACSRIACRWPRTFRLHSRTQQLLVIGCKVFEIGWCRRAEHAVCAVYPAIGS